MEIPEINTEMNLPGSSSLKTEVKNFNVFKQIEEECEEQLDNSILAESVELEDVHKYFEECRDNLTMKYAEKFQKDMQFALQDQNTNNQTLLDILKVQLASLKNAEDRNKIIKMSINELSKKYSRIDWKLFYEGLAMKSFTGDDIIEVHNPGSLEKAFEFMNKFNEERLVEVLQEFSSFQLYNIFFRVQKYKKQFCMVFAQELMPDVASKIQFEVKNASSTEISNCTKLFDNLKEILKSSLRQSSLENKSKESFMKKLDELKLGSISSVDSNETENNYKNVIVTTNYKENVLNLLKNYKKMLFSLVYTQSSAETLNASFLLLCYRCTSHYTDESVYFVTQPALFGVVMISGGRTLVPKEDYDIRIIEIDLPNRLTYFVSPFSTSPKTFYGSNFVVLHPAVFDRVPASYPKNIYVAKLGLLLAQEIAKHFDLVGRTVRTGIRSTDEYYRIIESKASEALDNHHLISPLRFHGTSFEFEQQEEPLFKNEMVAGNTAFRMVHYYLKTQGHQDIQLPWISDNFSSDQIIFINAAQEFCGKYSKALLIRDLYETRRLPFSLKIQIMMSSSPSFSTAFGCSDDSRMRMNTSSVVHFPYYGSDEESYRMTY